MSLFDLFRRKKAGSSPPFLERMDEWSREADISASNRIDIHFAKMVCVATTIAREHAIIQGTDVSNPAMDQLVAYCFIHFGSMAVADFKIGRVNLDDAQAGDVVMEIRHEAVIRYFNAEMNEKTAALMFKADRFLLKLDTNHSHMAGRIAAVLLACIQNKDDPTNQTVMGKTYGALHSIAVEYTQSMTSVRA